MKYENSKNYYKEVVILVKFNICYFQK